MQMQCLSVRRILFSFCFLHLFYVPQRHDNSKASKQRFVGADNNGHQALQYNNLNKETPKKGCKRYILRIERLGTHQRR